MTAHNIAVLIPVYNDQAGLDLALASVARDGYPVDVFVVDDGSSPRLRAPLTVDLIRLPSNVGVARALNAGLERILALGGYDYVARLDAGDVTLPGRFQAQVDFLARHGDHAVAGSDVTYFAGADDLWRLRPPLEHESIARELRWRNPIEHPSAMIRIAALEDCGCYDPRFCGAEDLELWRRFERAGWRLANLPRVYVRKEVTDQQVTANAWRSLPQLRVQLAYLEPFRLATWRGIIRSVAALVVSRRLWNLAKQQRSPRHA